MSSRFGQSASRVSLTPDLHYHHPQAYPLLPRHITHLFLLLAIQGRRLQSQAVQLDLQRRKAVISGETSATSGRAYHVLLTALTPSYSSSCLFSPHSSCRPASGQDAALLAGASQFLCQSIEILAGDRSVQRQCLSIPAFRHKLYSHRSRASAAFNRLRVLFVHARTPGFGDQVVGR